MVRWSKSSLVILAISVLLFAATVIIAALLIPKKMTDEKIAQHKERLEKAREFEQEGKYLEEFGLLEYIVNHTDEGKKDNEAKARYNTLVYRIKETEGEIYIESNKIIALNKEVDQLKLEKGEANKVAGQYKEQSEKNEAELNVNKSKIRELEKQPETLAAKLKKAELDYKNIKDENNKLKSDIIDANSRTKDAEKAKQEVETKLADELKKTKTVNEENNKLKADIKNANDTIDKLKIDIKKNQDEINRLKTTSTAQGQQNNSPQAAPIIKPSVVFPASPTIKPVAPNPAENSMMKFGSYDWRVLEVKGGKALLLMDNVLVTRQYHSQNVSVTWESSAIRKYLNGEFLNSFNQADRNRIADTKIITHNNPWYGTNGGAATTDKIFLLSLEELVQYFGDSGKLKNRPGQDDYYFNDQYGQLRIAYNKKDTASWWWLRSPGWNPLRAAIVDVGGVVGVNGSNVDSNRGGVRPALWLNL